MILVGYVYNMKLLVQFYFYLNYCLFLTVYFKTMNITGVIEYISLSFHSFHFHFEILPGILYH